MKKFLAMVLAAAMLLSLTACGKKKDKEKESTAPEEVQGQQVSTAKWGEFITHATQETVLTAKDGSTVTVAPVTYENGYVGLRATFLNKSDSVKCLKLSGFAINGMMLDAYMNVSAEAGQEAFDMFGVPQNELRVKGIFEIATIDLLFCVTDENWNTEDALSCQLKTEAAADYVADPLAYYAIINSQEAQEAVNYSVGSGMDERTDMGSGVYMESKVYVQTAEGEYLLLEVANESTEMRQVRINADTVNGMVAEGAGGEMILFPGAKAIFSLDMEWALPSTMREAFGVSQISNIAMYYEVYGCKEDGAVDWEAEALFNSFSYTIPNTSTKPDMSGTMIYDEHGLEITAKAPVEEYYSDTEKLTYVYLIFENLGSLDLNIRESGEDLVVNGMEEGVANFRSPYYMYSGDRVICYVSVNNMAGSSVVVPLVLQDINNTENVWYVDLTIPF